MTYADLDYNTQWEYKTVHARWGEFSNPDHLQRLLQQEALAGWVMIEPFNADAVCFRRHKQAAAWDHLLPPGIDAYRTLYTYTAEPAVETENLVILAGLVIVVIMLLIGVVLLFC